MGKKILVVSDNHGNKKNLLTVIEEWKDKIDALVHCGDSEFDVDYLMGRSEIRKDKDLLQIIKTPLTEEELSIIKAFRKTSKRNKQAIKILLGFYVIDEEGE